MITNSRSQAGQDIFTTTIIPSPTGRTFLDIGASHPELWSNTKALEELGWKGVLVDSALDSINMCKESRTSPAICCDACTCSWPILLRTHLPQSVVGDSFKIDYASVDIDEWTHEALKNLLAAKIRPAVMTVEHDFYQRGDRLRIPNRRVLTAAGFQLIAGDVRSNGCIFEDWWVAPELVDINRAMKFDCHGCDWKDVLRTGGVEIA
jgi:hypothetical protein